MKGKDFFCTVFDEMCGYYIATIELCYPGSDTKWKIIKADFGIKNN